MIEARCVVEEFRDKRLEVEARLALGEPSQRAARPYVRALWAEDLRDERFRAVLAAVRTGAGSGCAT